jgi:hypothetical protein
LIFQLKRIKLHSIKIELTTELKVVLALRHGKIHDGHERDRIKTVLLRSEDWGIKQIAQALRLHEASISRHIDEFLTLHKLNPESAGAQGYLNEEQTQQLIDHLCDVTSLHTQQIVAYIYPSIFKMQKVSFYPYTKRTFYA